MEQPIGELDFSIYIPANTLYSDIWSVSRCYSRMKDDLQLWACTTYRLRERDSCSGLAWFGSQLNGDQNHKLIVAIVPTCVCIWAVQALTGQNGPSNHLPDDISAAKDVQPCRFVDSRENGSVAVSYAKHEKTAKNYVIVP